MKMMDAAIAQSDMAICITDPRGILLQVNEAYRKLYKYPDMRSLVGRPVSIIRSPLTPAGLYADMWKTIAAGGIWRGQMNNRASDGSEVHIHLTVSPIRDQGLVTGYLGLSLDRAQQVILENQLLNANKLLAIGTLGSGLAHELNNPLASILLDAEHLRDCLADIIAGPAAEQAEQAAISIIHCAEKMRKVLEHLLLYSKPDSSQARSTISVAPFLQDCFLFLERHVRSLGIEVDIQAEPELSMVGNRMELESVLHVLLSNSIEAFSGAAVKEKRIRVSAAIMPGSPFLKIEYRDNAGGIAPEVLPHIFEPFFTTKGTGGSGLGLSLCRHILAAHKGQIECESSGGETLFRILLPLAGMEERNADGRVRAATAKHAAPAIKSRRKG